MFKVKLDIRGLFVKVEVKDVATGEIKTHIGEAYLGDAEGYGRSMANTIINKIKAERAESKIVEYEVE